MSSWISGVFRNFLSNESNPNTVREVRQEEYSNRDPHDRVESLVLYGSERGKQSQMYEIVLLRPYTETLSQAFRLV